MTPEEIFHSPDIAIEGIRKFTNILANDYREWFIKTLQKPASQHQMELFLLEEANLMENAQRVYWSNSLLDAAGRGAESAFDNLEVTSDLFGELTAKPQWWVTEEPTGLAPDMVEWLGLKDDNPYPWISRGHLLQYEPRTNEVYASHLLLRWADSPIYRNCAFRKHAFVGNPLVDPEAKRNLARIQFMQLPFVELDHRQPNRAARRQMEREGKEVPSIRVVQFRRKYQPGTHPQTGSSAEWHHHWLVKGHWRNQFYPSKTRHKPIYIAPHVKGDLDKPFLERPAVYRVER